MPSVGMNFEEIAEEFSQIPVSIKQFLDSMGGTIETMESTFEEGEIQQVDAMVASYYEVEGDMEGFDREVDKLLQLLRGEYDPDSVEEIEEIERVSRTLIQSIEQFQTHCRELADVFSSRGMVSQATAFEDVANALTGLPTAIKDSLFNNYLLHILKAEHFPGSLRSEVDDLVESLASATGEQRQNILGILVSLAEEEPELVAPHSETLAANLSNASPNIQHNLSSIFILLAKTHPEQTAHVKEQALELVDASQPQIAISATQLLVEHSLTLDEAERIADRIRLLLDQSTNSEFGSSIRINMTYVLSQLAESHPAAVDDEYYLSEVAALLNDSTPGVVENSIAFLGSLDRSEFADEIARARANSDDEGVVAEADAVLSGF